VQRVDTPGEIRAVPIRFGPPGKPAIVPEVGHHWGILPPSRATLRVLAGDRELGRDDPLPVVYGSELSLRVELVARDGSVRDVSQDERTRYETMTVWNLYSPGRGRVRAAALPEIDRKYIERAFPLLDHSEAVLFVYYGEPQDRDFGVAQVAFRVEAPPPAP